MRPSASLLPHPGRGGSAVKIELAPGQRVEAYPSITLRPKKGIRMTLALAGRLTPALGLKVTGTRGRP